jgi:tRNA pseudouridine55 synthase
MAQIIVVNKPIGLTPLQTLDLLRKHKPELNSTKLTYAGRLDPMAEGLLLVLKNPDQSSKEKLLCLDKTYQFKLLFGLSTDTYDALGIIQPSGSDPVGSHQPSRFTPSEVERSDLEGVLPSFLGINLQPYPPYSSKTVNGKPLFYYARTNQLAKITIPKKKIQIKTLKLISTQLILKSKLQSQIIQSLKLVKGDFRQLKIIKSWQQFFSNTKQVSFPVYTLETTCSSGTYIRSLAHKLGQKLNTQAIALNIKRTKLGPYKHQSAINLN